MGKTYRNVLLRALVLLLVAGAGLTACHAGEDDAAGLAGELDDPVRREHAIVHMQRIYSGELAKAKGDRNNAEVKALVDSVIEKLTAAYLAHREDTQNGTLMVRLMADMRDPRALPALLGALDWRAEVNEEHSVTAAETLQQLAIPDDKRGAVIEALSKALDRVTGARPKDAQMRNAFITTLGSYNDKRVAPALEKVMLAETESQNFLFNVLAAQQLARVADESSVPGFIKALFLYAPNNPGMRMNDVASEALVRIGKPSFEPLLEVLRGKNQTVNALVKRYIEDVRRQNANAAKQMSVPMLTGAEATFALGALGMREGFEPLMAEANVEDFSRRMNAVIALVRLNLDATQREKVRATLLELHEKSEDPNATAQLLAVMRHTYDPGFLPTFMTTLKDVENAHPAVRLAAVEAYALLANKAEAAELSSYLDSVSEDKEPYREELQKQFKPILKAARECDDDVKCWIGLTKGADKDVVRKAAYMLGRIGVGKPDALAALVPLLGDGKIEVRLAAVAALDHTASKGSPEAVAKIEELQKAEQGQKLWKDFAREALPIQARLRHRAGA